MSQAPPPHSLETPVEVASAPLEPAVDWSAEVFPARKIGPFGHCCAVLKALVLVLVLYGGLALHLLTRLIEAPIYGPARPWTPHITQRVCLIALKVLGLKLECHGAPMKGRGAVVANHVSWLDIFVLNACDRVYFVSKSEVSGWPGIGWLAKATGTLFITREASQARLQQGQFETRLRDGHRLLFFPEGTSTDGQRVLPFKPTLFAAFYTHGLDEIMQIQPASLRYHAPDGQDARFFGWWGGMGFFPHLWRVLAQGGGGRVEVSLHAPQPVDAFKGRKPLAAYMEEKVREGAL